MKATARVPGKVTLLGEHAVVYGQPAIVAAIDRYVNVEAQDVGGSEITVYAEDITLKGIKATITADGQAYSPYNNMATKTMSYILEALSIASKKVGETRGASIHIRSSMPVGAGLGTSAAVAVGTVAAYSALCGRRLKADELAELGRSVELKVQGMSSGMDAQAVSRGGVISVRNRGKGIEVRPLRSRIRSLGLAFVPRTRSTAEAVRVVAELKQGFPDVVERIFDLIGYMVLESEKAVTEGNSAGLGAYMNMNHGLLSALGVTNYNVENAVSIARVHGSTGAKLTGAGFGGAVVFVCGSDADLETVALALKHNGIDAHTVEVVDDGVSVTLE
ncbi:MAG: mevalonate kinase [Thermoprotei archaeon]